MNQWLVLFRKEWLELVRTYKLVWLPLVFILFGAMQPVMAYFLPDILAHAGNLPEGTMISIPVPGAGEIMAQTLQQFNTIGLLIITLSTMNCISAERANGLTAMILAKPVAFRSFVTAKWAANLALISIAFAGGFGAAYFYTSTLFQPPDVRGGLIAFLLYWLWLVLAGMLTLLFSAVLRSGAAAAACSLALLAGLAVSASLLPGVLEASPGMLPKLASGQYLEAGSGSPWPVIFISVVFLAAALETATFMLRRRPTLEA